MSKRITLTDFDQKVLESMIKTALGQHSVGFKDYPTVMAGTKYLTELLERIERKPHE